MKKISVRFALYLERMPIWELAFIVFGTATCLYLMIH